MASINELKEVLKETLEERGVLTKIRAQIRSEIFSTLNDVPPNRPELSKENEIVNELIREYLAFNGYQHTLSVFLPESGQPQHPRLDRNQITRSLKIVEDKKSQELPLLYGLTFGSKKQMEDER